MLKGQVFANQLFENQMFALFIDTFANGTNGVSNNYKNGMAVTYSGSNVTIDSGAILIQGRLLEEDTSTTISAGADNMYCKLIIEIDLDKTNTTTEFNQGAYKIIKGANDYPALTQTNIVKNNAGVYQYELARFRNPSTGIADFQDMRTFIDFEDIYEEIRQHIQDIDEGSLWVLKSGDTMTGALSVQGGITGNCSSATKLQTARNISLSGVVVGNQNFDGSQNIAISTTLRSDVGTDITIPGTYGGGNFILKFRRKGDVVQVECVASFEANKTSLQIQEQNITIPDWAKTSYTNTGRITPLITGEFHGQGISTTYGLPHIEIYKTTGGVYRATMYIQREDTSNNNMYYSGTYIV